MAEQRHRRFAFAEHRGVADVVDMFGQAPHGVYSD
jgi:hypothetical protein